MKNNNLPLVLLMVFIVNTSVSAQKNNNNYDYDEFTLGVSASSLNTTGIYNYHHSNSFSGDYYLTFNLLKRSPLLEKSNGFNFNQLFSSSTEIGIGRHQMISAKTDVYGALSYSKSWSEGLNGRFDSLHFTSGSITDVTDKFQLITETKFSKHFNYSGDDVGRNYQRKVGIEITAKFKLRNKKFLTTGISSSKGFPYMGISFK